MRGMDDMRVRFVAGEVLSKVTVYYISTALAFDICRLFVFVYAVCVRVWAYAVPSYAF